MSEQLTELTPREAAIVHRSNILSTIPRPRWQKVRADLMTLSPRINPAGGVSRRWVDFYKQYWAESLADPLRVLKLGADEYEIIDGRHRWLAVQELGLVDYEFQCLVHQGLSEAEVAALFQYFNTIRRTVSQEETQTVAALHGDPVALIVAKVLKEVPFKVSCYRTMQTIVERSHDLDEGETALRWALETINESFPTESDQVKFVARLVKPFGLFFVKHRSNPNFVPADIPWRVLAERMTARQLIHQGEEFGGNEGSAAFIVRRLTEMHDKGRRQAKRLKPD